MPTLKYVGSAGRYRLTSSDVDVAQGETVEVDEETAAHLQEHGEFETVDGDMTEDADVPIIASDATVDEIKATVADIEDAEAVRYILEDERDNQDRTTAIEVLEDRLAELED